MPSHANPVNWFEIPVTDLSRAKSFYETVLGVEITESEMGPNKMGWFPMEMGATGSAGTLTSAMGTSPHMMVRWFTSMWTLLIPRSMPLTTTAEKR